jgi:hypothetical protein
MTALSIGPLDKAAKMHPEMRPPDAAVPPVRRKRRAPSGSWQTKEAAQLEQVRRPRNWQRNETQGEA